MIKWLIRLLVRLDRHFSVSITFSCLIRHHFRKLDLKNLRSYCNYLPNEHIPKLKRKNTKIVKSLLALLNRLQWAENEQCAKHLIYMWAEQYVVYDWIRLYAHCDTTRRNFLSAILRNADKGIIS